jgi:hypothetical protein
MDANAIVEPEEANRLPEGVQFAIAAVGENCLSRNTVVDRAIHHVEREVDLNSRRLGAPP